MRNPLAMASVSALALLLLLALVGPEYVRLKRAQRDVADRTGTEIIGRAFGLEQFVSPGLKAAAQTAGPVPLQVEPMAARTIVSIDGERFLTNGKPTYPGRVWRGARIEGLLFNARMVHAIFDDWSPDRATHWAYPDTGVWDPDRNTAEFIEALPSWRDRGLVGITLNLQGGNAHGRHERWFNSAFDADGELHPAYFDRLRKVIVRADDLGMVVILGLFYFRNDEVLRDEVAVERAVDRTIDWLHDLRARNVLIEIGNECDVASYDHPILRCDRVHELVERAASRGRNGYRHLVSTSLRGGSLPSASLLSKLDFVLLHGNGIDDPKGITAMVDDVRALPGYRPMPIVFNEDDHYDFDRPTNNFSAATMAYASWGYHDRRNPGEPFEAGLQTVPVDWGVTHARKRAFLELLADMTGSKPADRP